VAVPATYCNSMLEFLQSKLELEYRSRLTEWTMKKYLGGEGNAFYSIGNLDDRIKNVDQLLTVDIAKFSKALAEI
jgi:ATP-binding cassette, subfamily D (ALD), peroxisomal long-chain fatty acid import protein